MPAPAPLGFDPIAEARRQWVERWGPEPAAPMAAVTSIMRVQQILLGRLNRVLAPFELTFARYEALMLLHLSRRGALPLGKMGDRLQVHRTSITSAIDRLGQHGLVRRLPHQTDRRTTLAEITARGREVAEAATAALNADGFLLPELSPPALEELLELLRRMRHAAGDFA